MGVLFLWIVGGMLLIFGGGVLLHAAGRAVAVGVAGVALLCWLASLYVWQNNIFSGLSFFTLAAAGFAVWLSEN